MDCKLCLLSANPFEIRIGMSLQASGLTVCSVGPFLSYNKDIDDVLRAGNREGYLC